MFIAQREEKRLTLIGLYWGSVLNPFSNLPQEGIVVSPWRTTLLAEQIFNMAHIGENCRAFSNSWFEDQVSYEECQVQFCSV